MFLIADIFTRTKGVVDEMFVIIIHSDIEPLAAYMLSFRSQKHVETSLQFAETYCRNNIFQTQFTCVGTLQL